MTALDRFRVGQPWLDTEGKRIHAHGGSIIMVGEDFYWYGENKERTVPGSGIWHWGVRMYRSRDLYNWQDVGIVLPPETDDPQHPLHPSQSMDRPHIIHCPRTGKFVMWMKIMGRDHIQYQTVATADQVTGPYRVLRSFRPLGMSCGDFDLVIEPSDGKAYYYFERVHSEFIIADLSDDCTDVTGYYSTHFPQPGPPRVREAPAWFRRGHLNYLITSGTTGYFPNRSELACSPSHHGPWRVLGDPHPGDPEHTSYRSQISSVFRHPGRKDLYIALADRWLTDLPRILPDIPGEFEAAFNSVPPDWERLRRVDAISSINTSLADYVWLPLRFDGDMAIIDWRDEWKVEEFPLVNG